MAKRKYPIITIISNRTIEGVNSRKDISVIRYQEASNLLEILKEGIGNNVEMISNNQFVIQASWVNNYGRKIHVHNLYIIE